MGQKACALVGLEVANFQKTRSHVGVAARSATPDAQFRYVYFGP
jgi:hypothetical protein